MSMRLLLGVVFLAALGLAACDSHGGDVTPNNPLNPTSPPSGSPTTRPTASPTAGPTATPTNQPSMGPTPTPTGTVAVCSAPPPDPNTSTVTLTGSTQTISVPCFGDFTSTAVVPPNTPAGTAVALGASTDQTFGATPVAGDGTPLLYTSLKPSTGLQFAAGASIVTTVTSPSKISVGHVYDVNVCAIFSPGGACAEIQPAPVDGNITATGNSITFNVTPPGGSFPAVQAVVIVYQKS